MIVLLLLLSMQSSYFLRMTPGVMSQGLGGSSVMIDEGLSVFHNPAQNGVNTLNFTLSRWLYSTNYLALGGTHDRYSFGVSYMNYGRIEGFDDLGNPTEVFTPYDICAAFGYQYGIFGIALKGFAEQIADHTLYGVAGSLSMYVQYSNLAIGAKLDNVGKEFAESTTIPYYAAIGLKYNITKDTGFLVEAKLPEVEVNSGLVYRYQDLTLLLGAKYLRSIDQVASGFDDVGVTGGVLISIDDYRIGYSIVYGYSSIAHQFSVSIIQ
jgi:hypothetical protein